MQEFLPREPVTQPAWATALMENYWSEAQLSVATETNDHEWRFPNAGGSRAEMAWKLFEKGVL